MARFKVQAISEKTGKESFIIVSTSDEISAVARVQAMGLLTGKVERMPDSVPKLSTTSLQQDGTSQSARTAKPPGNSRVAPPVIVAVVGIAMVLSVIALMIANNSSPGSPRGGESALQTRIDRPQSSISSVPSPPKTTPKAEVENRPPSQPVPLPPTHETPPSPKGASRAHLSPVILRGPYMFVPIVGEIGSDVLATGVRDCLQAARDRHLKTVVFDIDSPGGLVSEARDILKVLNDDRADMQYVARIRKAFSAAIVFALESDVILVSTDSAIGGAVAFVQSNTTGAAEVDAKMNSILGAELAVAGASRGHDAAVTWAMCVQEKSLYLVPGDPGQPPRLMDYSPRPEIASRMIDGPQSVLTLDGTTAVDIGFARFASDTTSVKMTDDFIQQMSGLEIMNAAARARREKMLKTVSDALAAERDRLERERRVLEEEESRKREAEQEEQAYARDFEEIKGLIGRIEEYMRDAADKHPRAYSDYYTDAYGNYTFNSVQLWQARSSQAIAAWKDVKAGLQDIADRMKNKKLDETEPAMKSLVERYFDRAGLEISRLTQIRNYPQ